MQVVDETSSLCKNEQIAGMCPLFFYLSIHSPFHYPECRCNGWNTSGCLGTLKMSGKYNIFNIFVVRKNSCTMKLSDLKCTVQQV